jgi:hypothetical protein
MLILLPSFVSSFIHRRDEVTVPANFASADAATEVYVRAVAPRDQRRDCFLAEVGYITRPRKDKRNDLFVSAAVCGRYLGISVIHIRCDLVRDYFYVGNRQCDWDRQPSLYELLRVDPKVSPTDLRLAFRVRDLELRTIRAPVHDIRSLERAFNILAFPELRDCYDGLLADPSAPAVFPYGGFGSLFVSGTLAREGTTFYASHIVSFLPQQVATTIHVPLRKCSFFDQIAVYRDARRKSEIVFDQAATPMLWNATWNQWKHFLAATVRVKGTFIQGGRYRQRKGEWDLVRCRTALPSRIEITLPPNFVEQVDQAWKTYHRFGEFADAIDQIRRRLETTPMERDDLRAFCSGLGIPNDFDVSLVTWKPDYDPFFYKQLYRRARRVYFFRCEYIFDLERAVVIETPQLGHATYVFAKPAKMEEFLAIYGISSRDDVLRNRCNVAESLGFLCRLVHGSSPANWLKDLRARIGEALVPSSASMNEESPAGS